MSAPTVPPVLTPLMRGYEWGTRYVFAEPPRMALGAMGNLLSRRSGSSLEFMEHREYLPGDDLRRIDWNAFARSDRLAVKMYREEVHPQVDLLLDCSRSMRLAETRKNEAALALAGFFAATAAESHFSFAVHLAEEGCRKLGRSNLLPSEWEPFEFNGTQSPAESLERMAPAWKPRGIRIVISDLLFPADPDTLVSRIATESAVAVFVQLLAEADAEPPGHGNLRLTDVESGERMEFYLDAGARERYQSNLARHQENYHLACRRHGAHFTTVRAESFLENPDPGDLLHAELLRYK
ncbi:MAG TPA: hypothetical protein DEB39_01375 [Planctomycetaceae bacterium]|nr:hypothetical protein [Planctomycetaceae bacterium]